MTCSKYDQNDKISLNTTFKITNMPFNIVCHRHWKELMERTGTNFEMNPDTFTLENMFAMELHKYANVIGDIVTSAVKELSIEKVSFSLNKSPRIQLYLFISEIINTKILYRKKSYYPYKVCVCVCLCVSRE